MEELAHSGKDAGQIAHLSPFQKILISLHITQTFSLWG